MNNGTHFIGQPMYGQLLNLLDKAKILRFSRENGGELGEYASELSMHALSFQLILIGL